MWHSAVSQILPGSGDYASCFISVVKPELQDNGYLTCLAIQLTYLLFLNEPILEMTTKAPRFISAVLLGLRKPSSLMPLPSFEIEGLEKGACGAQRCLQVTFGHRSYQKRRQMAFGGEVVLIGEASLGSRQANRDGFCFLLPLFFPSPSFSRRHLPNHDPSPPMLRQLPWGGLPVLAASSDSPLLFAPKVVPQK